MRLWCASVFNKILVMSMHEFPKTGGSHEINLDELMFTHKEQDGGLWEYCCILLIWHFKYCTSVIPIVQIKWNVSNSRAPSAFLPSAFWGFVNRRYAFAMMAMEWMTNKMNFVLLDKKCNVMCCIYISLVHWKCSPAVW